MEGGGDNKKEKKMQTSVEDVWPGVWVCIVRKIVRKKEKKRKGWKGNKREKGDFRNNHKRGVSYSECVCIVCMIVFERERERIIVCKIVWKGKKLCIERKRDNW